MNDAQHALIVEDRSDWQGIITRTLASVNWQSDVASTFEEALDLLAQKQFDLAVIDPVLDNSNKFNRDGLRVLSEIHKRFPQTALIVVSGSITHTALHEMKDVPHNLALIEKQHWDSDAFKKMVVDVTQPATGRIGHTTVVQMLRAAVQFQPTAQETPPEPAEGSRRGKQRILIVEDRPDWQVILANAVEEEDWFWRIVPSAGKALPLLKKEAAPFHIVLLDLRLSDGDRPLREGEGWQLLDHLAQANHKTRVIIISGEASRGDVATLFMSYPIAGFLDKDSFHKNELLELIYKLTDIPQIRVQTFGGFQVWRDDEPIDDYGSDAAELLLKILVTFRGQTLTRARLAKLTGTDVGSLDTVIDATRRALQPDLVSPADSVFILSNSNGVSLDTSRGIDLDFDMLEQLLQDGKAHQQREEDAEAMKLYEKGAKLHQGEYLANDRVTDWSAALRVELQVKFARLLNRLADLYAKQNRLDDAIRTAQETLQNDPYHESTHRRLMRYHYCKGDKDTALTVYATLEKLRREFFEEEPREETRALRDSILADETVPCVEQLDA
jgi:DNA-binding SARP family transcriptional activator/ActR/RegA family two-component response regulator